MEEAHTSNTKKGKRGVAVTLKYQVLVNIPRSKTPSSSLQPSLTIAVGWKAA
jgi:hypothetical protein